MSALLQQITSNHATLLAHMKVELASPDMDTARRWADALRRGSIFFCSEEEIQIGLSNVDWGASHLAHQEWPQSLNRFLWLKFLVEVHNAGEGDDLPLIARGFIEDWIRQHDYGADKSLFKRDSTLNISVRLGLSKNIGWWPTVTGFNRPDIFDDDFLKLMIESSRGQLDYLRHHLSLGANWRISELDCLLYCAMVVPGLDEHLDFAVRMLNECFHRQVEPDGSHIEHVPDYHEWMCDVMTAYWRLSMAKPQLGLHCDAERVARMWNYRACSIMPDGGSCALNDSVSHSPTPDKLESILKRRAEVIEEAGLTGPEWDLEASPSRYFPNAGQAFLRTNWSDKASMTIFDAFRWHGWHSHLGRNSVNLFDNGRYLLPDPGIFNYEPSDPFAAYGRSTRAHNTLNMALANQSVCNPEMLHARIYPDIAVFSSRFSGGYFDKEFTGSWREGHGKGIFGMHHRLLIWLGAQGAIVWDFCRFDTEQGQRYAIHWNLPVGPSACDSESHCAWSVGEDRNILVKLMYSSDETNCRIAEGEKVPILGWQCRHAHSGNYIPSPMAVFEATTGRVISSSATLLLPFDGKRPPSVRTETFSCCEGQNKGIHAELGNGLELIAAASHALSAQVGNTSRLSTDGSAVMILSRENKPLRALVVDGTFLSFDGEKLIDKNKSGIHRHPDTDK